MQKTPIRGTTDWRKYDLVLDVPADSISISYGLLLIGPRGKAWLDDLNLDVVTGQVPITGSSQNALRELGSRGAATMPNSPANLGFENGYQTNFGYQTNLSALGALDLALGGTCGGQFGSTR
jgi:hypothetical protein